MHVVPLTDDLVRQAAAVLHEGFAEHAPDAWPTEVAAVAEVQQALAADRVAFAAVDDGRLQGWIGALPTEYGAMTWELHPLVVAAHARRQGIGGTLVELLLRDLAQRGVTTVMLGTDDLDQMTSIGGTDLYPGVLAHLTAIEDRRGHPFGFFARMGFEIVGVVPDANGLGRPDILMATRLRPWAER